MAFPAYDSIGRSASDISKGFQPHHHKVAISTKTTDGVALALAYINKGDAADLSLKAAHSTKKHSVDITFNTTEKVAINASYSELAPGLKVTGQVTLPDTKSGKLGVIYGNPYVHLKALVGLTSAPKVDLWGTTGHKQLVLGAHGSFDTAKSQLSSWSVAAGYHGPDIQAAAFVDRGETLRLSLAHQASPDKAFAAEISRKIFGATSINFALSHQRKLSSGAVAKYRLDQAGQLQVLFSQVLTGGEKLQLSTQLDTFNLTTAPKVGVAVDLA